MTQMKISALAKGREGTDSDSGKFIGLVAGIQGILN